MRDGTGRTQPVPREPALRPPRSSATLLPALWGWARACLWGPLGSHTAPVWLPLHSPEPSGPGGAEGAGSGLEPGWAQPSPQAAHPPCPGLHAGGLKSG